jgi:DNA-binding PadR family transcriptional regulator
MSEKEKFSGEFEQMVLLALLKLKDDAYSASIRQLLHDQVGRDVVIGALYSTLERLENKGMASSKFGEATPQRGGRPKKFFAVTSKGMQALKRAREAMDKLWQDVIVNYTMENLEGAI